MLCGERGEENVLAPVAHRQYVFTVPRPLADAGREIINNVFSIIIDPRRLGTAANLAAGTAEFAAWVKQSPVAQGVDRIKLPGEPEQDHRRERGAKGIPIDPATWTEIIGAAVQLGLTRREVEQLAGQG